MSTGGSMLNARRHKSTKLVLHSVVPTIALFYAISPFAQPIPRPSSPKYDVQTETKIKATVEDVRLPSGTKEIVYLVIKSGTDATVEVYLCPKSFLNDMGVTFAKGDQITITGSKVKQNDADIILAREVVKGTDTLVLRDDKGNPVWS
jgi:hypothetical protein